MSTPIEEPVPGERTVFVIYDDGSVGRLTVAGGGAPQLSKPGRVVSEDEYLARLAVLEEQQAAHLADLQAADEARALADYQALLEAGIPEETARRMSGYTGPAPVPASTVGEGAEV